MSMCPFYRWQFGWHQLGSDVCQSLVGCQPLEGRGRKEGCHRTPSSVSFLDPLLCVSHHARQLVLSALGRPQSESELVSTL